jgi:cyclopropane fatty-acyl-phospholipid synthase-like methyltransferase
MDNKITHSNKDVDWASHYDYYEVELRDIYRTVSKPQNDSHFEMVKQYLRNYLNKGKIFAEIGFSAGLTIRSASPYFKKVFGLDISPRNVEFTKDELAKEGFTNIELHTLDILKYDENCKGKFDVISFIHGLEHFSETDYPKLFENIKYYLNEGGVFTGALPNNLDPTYRMCPNCGHHFEIDGHLAKHTIETLKELFSRNGFEILYLNNFNFQYYRKSKGVLKYLYKLIMYKILKKQANGQLEYIVKPRV